jgi:hypothetical protein
MRENLTFDDLKRLETERNKSKLSCYFKQFYAMIDPRFVSDLHKQIIEYIFTNQNKYLYKFLIKITYYVRSCMYLPNFNTYEIHNNIICILENAIKHWKEKVKYIIEYCMWGDFGEKLFVMLSQFDDETILRFMESFDEKAGFFFVNKYMKTLDCQFLANVFMNENVKLTIINFLKQKRKAPLMLDFWDIHSRELIPCNIRKILYKVSSIGNNDELQERMFERLLYVLKNKPIVKQYLSKIENYRIININALLNNMKYAKYNDYIQVYSNECCISQNIFKRIFDIFTPTFDNCKSTLKQVIQQTHLIDLINYLVDKYIGKSRVIDYKLYKWIIVRTYKDGITRFEELKRQFEDIPDFNQNMHEIDEEVDDEIIARANIRVELQRKERKDENIYFEEICGICAINPNERILLPCRHTLCSECVKRVVECPFCKQHIDSTLSFKNIVDQLKQSNAVEN